MAQNVNYYSLLKTQCTVISNIRNGTAVLAVKTKKGGKRLIKLPAFTKRERKGRSKKSSKKYIFFQNTSCSALVLACYDGLVTHKNA